MTDDELGLGGLVDAFEGLDRDQARQLAERLKQEAWQARQELAGGGARHGDDFTNAVNGEADFILRKHGVQLDADELAQLRRSGAAADFLEDVEKLAKSKRRAQSQASLRKQYDAEMAALIKNGAGSHQKIMLRQDFRAKGLEI